MSNAVNTQYCAKAQLQPLSQEALNADLIPAEDITYLPAHKPLLTPVQVATAKKLGGLIARKGAEAVYYSLMGTGALILLFFVALVEIGKAIAGARPKAQTPAHDDYQYASGPARPHKVNVEVNVKVNVNN